MRIWQNKKAKIFIFIGVVLILLIAGVVLSKIYLKKPTPNLSPIISPSQTAAISPTITVIPDKKTQEPPTSAPEVMETPAPTPTIQASATPTPVAMAVTQYFYSDFCHWCQEEKNVIQQLEGEGYPFSWMSVDEHPNYWQDYNLSGTPTFILGNQRTSGYKNYNELKVWINQNQ